VIIDDNQENPMVYGWNIGFGIENAFFDDFSLRAEYNYQLYNSFKTEAGTKINPNNGEFMLGLSYRIIL
jgi:opacity protein-like surface antigen